MSYYKVIINNRETVIRTEASLEQLGLEYGSSLLGMCDIHGNLSVRYTPTKVKHDDGTTSHRFEANGRLHSMRYGNGEFSSISVPIEAIPTLMQIKGVEFRSTPAPSESKIIRDRFAYLLNQLHTQANCSCEVMGLHREFAIERQYITARSFGGKRIHELLGNRPGPMYRFDTAEKNCVAFLLFDETKGEYVRHFAIRFKNNNWLIEE